MVSDSDLVARLREILRGSDLETATAGSVRRQLEEDFAADLSDRKAFIRDQIDVYLEEAQGADEDDANVMAEDGEEGGDAQEEEEEEEEEEAEGKGSRKRRKTSGKESKRRGGFTKLCSLSPQLQNFVGVPALARTEVVKKIWCYIREKELQDPKDRRKIICDEVLKGLFRVNSINMFQMNKALAKHILPLNPEDEAVCAKAGNEEDASSPSAEEANSSAKEIKEEEIEEANSSVKEIKDEEMEEANSSAKEIKEEEIEDEEREEEEEEEEKEEEANGRGRKKRGSSKGDKAVKRRGGGFTKVCALSPQLQVFTGVPHMARTEVVKKLWSYIKENSLQNPKNKRSIICDDTFRALFRVDSIDMFQMNKALSKHIWPLDEEEASVCRKMETEEVADSLSAEETSCTPKVEEEAEEEDVGIVEEKTSKGGGRRKRNSDEDKGTKKRGGGFAKVCSLSEQLQTLMGVPELARTEVVKKLWAYIREKNLQDPNDKRTIICDESLRALFEVDSINMFQMNKALSKHIWPLNKEDERASREETTCKRATDEDEGCSSLISS